MLGRDIQNASGLQDTVLGQNLKFKSMPHTPFVQIIHDGRFHWVALSRYGCQEGEVFLLDSLFSGTITQKVKQQICQIMKCPSDTIKVKIASVQQQSNGIDCGVFSIAFVQSILLGDDISLISYDQVRLRSHLLQCLLRNKLSPFPPALATVKRCKARTIEIPVYCNCRQLWLKSDDRIFSR